jgi:hypothetical protein
MGDTKIEKIKDQLARAKNALANIKEHTEHASALGMSAIMTAAGGSAAAVLDVKMATIPGTEIDSKLAVGSTLCALALFDVAGDYSEQLNALGAGMLAVSAHEATKKALEAA